ncbi:LapA family protein [Senegalia massiliensis]|uniref:LapA family protein n=1 Tax=Senegalia massiliensis TaxID=1720316 RepID=A0A845R0G1_9CLOT|nr:LapA family protein [Senegalia massiliensis]NBI06932.1 LapA family protein [Senegalia massiliensis]
MQLGFILSLLFAVLIATFAVQNSASVAINFLFTKVEVSQALVIFISAALGAIIVAFLGLVKHRKMNKTINQQKLEIEKLKKDCTRLDRKKQEKVLNDDEN